MKGVHAKENIKNIRLKAPLTTLFLLTAY